MPTYIPISRGSDAAVHIPIPAVGPGWSARAEVKEWPGQDPPVQVWSNRDGSAQIETGEVVLICSDSRSWSWTSGELAVHLTDPQGMRDVAGPWRCRLR